MTPPRDVVEILERLEQELLRGEVRRSRECLEQMLAAEFREFGSSGRVYEDRDAMVAALAKEGDVVLRLSDLRMEMLGEESVLLTYRSFREGEGGRTVASLRSSVWVWREKRWQMVFHQGTRVEEAG